MPSCRSCGWLNHVLGMKRCAYLQQMGASVAGIRHQIRLMLGTNRGPVRALTFEVVLGSVGLGMKEELPSVQTRQ